MPHKSICPVCGRLDILVPVDAGSNKTGWRCRRCDSPWVCKKVADNMWVFKHELDWEE